MSVLILGGSRFMGRHIAEQLVAAGGRPVMLNRGSRDIPPGVEFVRGDRSVPGGLAGLAGRTFDAVVDLSAYQSAWVADAADALAGRVGHYVFISSGSVYAPSPELPWPEDATGGPDPAWGAYAVEKVAAERALARAAAAFPVTVLRLPYVLGAANYADREAFLFSRIAAGRPILLPGAGRAINQYVHAADVARAVLAVIGRPLAQPYRVYNVGLPTAITNAALVALAASIAGRAAITRAVDVDALGVASPVVDLTDFVFPFPDSHYFLDVRAIERDLGFRAAHSLEATLREFYAWWLTQPDRAPRPYARESRALAALKLAA
jgi:nucleoside-diphosphate-sugar epimerase